MKWPWWPLDNIWWAQNDIQYMVAVTFICANIHDKAVLKLHITFVVRWCLRTLPQMTFKKFGTQHWSLTNFHLNPTFFIWPQMTCKIIQLSFKSNILHLTSNDLQNNSLTTMTTPTNFHEIQPVVIWSQISQMTIKWSAKTLCKILTMGTNFHHGTTCSNITLMILKWSEHQVPCRSSGI